MLIIFDVDGVLVKASWEGLFEAYKTMITELERDYTMYFMNLQEFKNWWSPDWRKNNQRLNIRQDELEKAHWIFYEIYNSYVHLFPWVYRVLKQLSKKHRLVSLTNRHRSNAIKHLGPVRKYLEIIVGAENVNRLKPDPEGINLILSKTDAARKETLMIGDMADDLMAGKAAGIKTGAVKWGLGNWDELMVCSPDYAFEEPQHLLEI